MREIRHALRFKRTTEPLVFGSNASRGQVLGPRLVLGNLRYQLWDPSGNTLMLPSSITSSSAFNDSGLVAGSYSQQPLVTQAMTWSQSSGLVSQELPPGFHQFTFASGLNQQGETVGTASAGPALYWNAAGLVVTLLAEQSARANAINNHGQMVGLLSDPTGTSGVPFAGVY